MQPDCASLPMIRRIAAKETTLFFASPIAYLFLASFAAVTLFIFFWGEAFFARNIADVRPLFEWMPLLLIFLASTLTMRLWSEERRSGTLEPVLTQPVPLWNFVLGKFMGCLALLAIALLITLPLPISVAIIGELDWGPVLAGYLATLLLGAAYLSIGLYVSARSDNQIVSLISATAVCGVFYLLGNSTITDSPATKTYLSRLQEPLLLRGYFSGKTHPLLAPLVPQLKDLMREYQIAGNGKVRVEFVDPLKEPELEQEANQKYGIQATPFQVADRYQSAIVSSYFNVLVQYGDEHQILGFRDLIELKANSETDLEVQLRNPEHDLTRAIKKVLNAYQSGGNLFDTVKGKLAFNAYISPDANLPTTLVGFGKTVKKVIEDTQAGSAGRLSVNFIDPDADGGKVAKQIAEDFGLQPMAASLFSDQRFYFYLTLANDKQIVQIPLDDFSEDAFKRNLEAGIKRFASGFTKTVALVAPTLNPAMMQYGMSGPQFDELEKFLGAELNVQPEDLSDGQVSGDADILLLLAPKGLDDKQVFAVDQFLMQGGTVIAATSPYAATLSPRNMSLAKQDSGISDWLAHNGLKFEDKLVMDPQNSAFPLPVTRNVAGFMLQEMRMLDYPYFIDIRGNGLNQNNPITADLPQLTMAWASPIVIDKEKQGQRTLTELLHSSEVSWLSDSTDIMPRVDANGGTHYGQEGETGSHLLGVISAGRFDSYFAGKSSPLLQQEKPAEQQKAGWPVATTKSSHEGFEVAEDKFQRRLQFYHGDKLAGELLIGTSPGFKKSHVRKPGDDNVYAVNLRISLQIISPFEKGGSRGI